MTDDTFIAWFELRPEHGVDHAGNLEPIGELALTLALPRMTPEGILATGQQVCVIRPADRLTDELLVRVIPGTRIVETSSMLAAQSLYALALFEQLVDEPTVKQIKAARDETAAHGDAMDKRAEAVRIGEEHPPDVNDPNPAPQPLTGAVSFALNADERLMIDTSIAAGDILDDDSFAGWLAETKAADVLTAVGINPVIAKRALAAETERGEPRKGLVAELHKILTTDTEA
jgi:hypothetical protein